MEKIAIYDFCETIANFQTANAFIEYAATKKCTEQVKKVIRNRNYYSRIGIKTVTNVIGHFTNYYFDKYYLLSALRGMEREQIEKLGECFYQDQIKNNLIEKVVSQIEIDKNNGYSIVLISASYYPVVMPFCKRHCIDRVITNEFEYDENDCFTGKLIDKDCLGYNKVKRLIYEYPNFNVEESISYSDSKSDIPILKCVNRGVVVSKNHHQKWIDAYKFDEIIW